MTMKTSHPNPPTKTMSGGSTSDKHCVFRCGQSLFSMPATSVREIIMMPSLVAVPNAHSSLAGLCHLQSEFMPVISLTALLNGSASDDPQSQYKLIVIQDANSWALRITEAIGLVPLETHVTSECRTDDAEHLAVMGTAMFQDQIVRVLDSTALYRCVRTALEDLWTATNPSTYASASSQQDDFMSNNETWSLN